MRLMGVQSSWKAGWSSPTEKFDKKWSVGNWHAIIDNKPGGDPHLRSKSGGDPHPGGDSKTVSVGKMSVYCTV